MCVLSEMQVKTNVQFRDAIVDQRDVRGSQRDRNSERKGTAKGKGTSEMLEAATGIPLYQSLRGRGRQRADLQVA